MIEKLMIPNERKAILIGKNGAVKKEIEKKTETHLKIDDDVTIEGEAIGFMKAVDIVKAIGRGFSPEHALLLLKDDYEFHVITLQKETPNTVKRLMARVIGRKGGAKKIIEEETDSAISVYGKTVSIIATNAKMPQVEAAVEALLLGKKHGHAYSKLRKWRK